jgi:effector-binding domain-containing protein
MKTGIHVVNHEATHGLAVRETVGVAELPEFFGKTFQRVGEYIGRKGGKIAGMPFATYYRVTEGTADVEAGFPAVFDVIENLPGEAEIHAVDYPAGPVVEYVYFGPYDGMETAYGEIAQWLRENRKEAAGPPSEVYYSEPQGDPATWETHIIQPFR